jgi:uncharacterized protein (DUF433 family)
MEIAPHITVDPAIHHGTPIITGTRVPAEIIVGSLAGGMSKTEVMTEYDLTQTQVEAALLRCHADRADRSHPLGSLNRELPG